MSSHFQLFLTSVGGGKLADSANVALNNVQLRQMAVGSGSGPGTADDADARTTLRSQEAISALEGSAQPDSGRIGATATFAALTAGDPDVEIREVGIFARVGDSGTEFLLAYGARPAAGTALTTLADTGPTLVTGVIDISSSSADVAITVDPTVTFQGLDGATTAESAAGLRNDRAVTPAGLAFALRSSDQAATAIRRGTMFAATTQAHATDADNETRAITPKALNAVLGLITVLHFTASNPNYTWNLPFSRALVILKGADGGGGGAGDLRTIDLGDHWSDYYGATGGTGGNTVVTVDGVEYGADGGPGGSGGGRRSNGNALGGPDSVFYSGAGGMRRSGNGGLGGGRTSASVASDQRAGGSGILGEFKVVLISGLNHDDTLAITVGSGGSGGARSTQGASWASNPDGAAGADGWARIIPLPSDA